MAGQDKRVIEQQATSEVFADDWFLKDSVTEGTTKISSENLKAWINDGMATEGDIETVVKNIADTYSESESYAEGDLCIHEYALFKCTGTTTGTWDSTKWQATTVAELLDSIDLSAEAISYDNTSSGLEADNVQDAIDEVLSALKIVRDIPNTPTAIAAFSDGSDLPMPKLEVGIEAVQDLHGYDAPWVGGAGKNKFDESNFNDDTSWQYYTLTLNPNTTYTASSNNGNYYEDNTFPQLYVYATGSGAGSNNAVYTGHSVNITTGSDGVLKVQWKTNNNSKKMTSYHLQVEQGNQATSYAPYSNICPISGWSAVDVVDDAVYGGFINWNQLVQNGNFASTSNWTTAGQATLSVSNNIANLTPTAQWGRIQQGSIPFITNHKYYCHYELKGKNTTTYSEINGTGRYVSGTDWNIFSKVIVGDSTKAQMVVFGESATSNFVTITIKNIQIIDLTQAFGSTIADYIYSLEQATAGSGVAYFKSLFYKDYYPYNSGEITNVSAVNGDTDKYKTYTIDLDGTRYGGTLDVVSGVLTVDRAMVDLGTLSWTRNTYAQGGYSYFRSGAFSGWKDGSYPNFYCSNYKNKTSRLSMDEDGTIAPYTDSRYDEIFIRDDRFTDATAFKTAMNGVQLVYELATPLTIQLPTTVVKSLRGMNNVYADSGDVLDGKYIADASSTIASLDARITALENQ